LVSRTNEVDEKDTFLIYWWMDEVLAEGQLAWRVAFATDELLHKYDSYVEFVEEADFIDWIRDYRYAFIPYVEMRDFQWIEIGWRASENPHRYQQSVLFSAGDLPPGVPFVVKPVFRGMPNNGLSFLDTNGVRRYFAIYLNMASWDENPSDFTIIEFNGE